MLFKPTVGLKRITANWYVSSDGSSVARELFHRHYSYRPYRDGRQPKLFVGPGSKLVLLTREADALFVWRKFRPMDGQEGLNCSIFRNENPLNKSSDLILEAESAAWTKWGRQRLYTYVNPAKVNSRNPGYCFKKAGWSRCGVTKSNRLDILEKKPWNP